MPPKWVNMQNFQNPLAFSNSAHKKISKTTSFEKIEKKFFSQKFLSISRSQPFLSQKWVKTQIFQNPLAFSNSAHKKYLKQPYLKKTEKKNFFSKNF